MKNWKGFKKTNYRNFEYYCFENPIISLASSKNSVLWIEEIEKRTHKFT